MPKGKYIQQLNPLNMQVPHSNHTKKADYKGSQTIGMEIPGKMNSDENQRPHTSGMGQNKQKL